MCGLLNLVFDRCSVPEEIRHMLMFVDEATYYSWSVGLRVMSLQQHDTAIKYTRLYRVLTEYFGDDDEISRWLFSENNAPVFDGRSPIARVLDEGELLLDEALEALELASQQS